MAPTRLRRARRRPCGASTPSCSPTRRPPGSRAPTCAWRGRAWRRTPFRDVAYAEDQALLRDIGGGVFVRDAAVVHGHAYGTVGSLPPLLRRVPRAARALRLDGAGAARGSWREPCAPRCAATAPRAARRGRSLQWHAARVLGAALGTRADRLPRRAPGAAVARGTRLMRWLAARRSLLAILLRFPTLGQQSFWTDEASTALELHGGLGHLLASVRDLEGMPPGYFVLAWLWSRVFGLGEAGLRSLSACLGVAHGAGGLGARPRAAAGGGAARGRRSWPRSPFLVWYSQEARPYALLVLVTALMTLFWVQGRPRPVGAWPRPPRCWCTTSRSSCRPAGRRPAAARRLCARCSSPPPRRLALAPLILSQADARVDWVTDTSLLSRIGDVAKHFAQRRVRDARDRPRLPRDRGPRRRGVRAARGPVLAVAAVAAALPVLVALVGADYVLDRYVIAALVPLLASWRPSGCRGPSRSRSPCCSPASRSTSGPTRALQREDWRGLRPSAPAAPRFVVASPDAQRPAAVVPPRPGRSAPQPRPASADLVAVAAYRDGRRRPPTPGPPAAFGRRSQRGPRDALTTVRYRAAAPRRSTPAAFRTQNLDTRPCRASSTSGPDRGPRGPRPRGPAARSPAPRRARGGGTRPGSASRHMSTVGGAPARSSPASASTSSEPSMCARKRRAPSSAWPCL